MPAPARKGRRRPASPRLRDDAVALADAHRARGRQLRERRTAGSAGGAGRSATGAAAAPAPVAPTAAEQKTAAASALAVERQWLASWFDKTPVVIGQRSDGAVTIDVPSNFCFEPGRSTIKPALAAVLDKVAESLRRVPGAQLPLLAAPEDASGTARLALPRATEIREHLRSRGVPTTRLGKPAATTRRRFSCGSRRRAGLPLKRQRATHVAAAPATRRPDAPARVTPTGR